MRIVIKIGTQVIAGKNGLSHTRLRQIIGDIALLIKKGHEVILVSSGAVGAGRPKFPHLNSPFKKKIWASVGQPLLMHDYIVEAKKYKIIVGQVLILSDDFTNKERFKNFVSNIEAMLKNKILPIINENDVMKMEDLTIGDNDNLSAQVAVGLKANRLLILTDKNGLYTSNPDHNKNAKLIKQVAKVDSKIENLCSTHKSEISLGGMLSKVQSAKYATKGGVETLIGNGNKKGVILQALNESFFGTRFIVKNKKK